ncbi:MAG: DUF3311 domain-containing protein [Halanaeroarchaeum sp.]
MDLRSLSWVAIFGLLLAFAIPWFLWGSSTVVAGLPIWLWWHVGWMGLAAVVFWTFSRRAWGLGITDTGTRGGGGDPL